MLLLRHLCQPKGLTEKQFNLSAQCYSQDLQRWKAVECTHWHCWDFVAVKSSVEAPKKASSCWLINFAFSGKESFFNLQNSKHSRHCWKLHIGTFITCGHAAGITDSSSSWDHNVISMMCSDSATHKVSSFVRPLNASTGTVSSRLPSMYLSQRNRYIRFKDYTRATKTGTVNAQEQEHRNQRE
jgi:hypothetical protein